MPKGKPVAGELIQWLQTLDPHRSLTGERDSNYFFVGDLPGKQAVFVAQGDKVVTIRDPGHDWLDEDVTGYWRS